MRGRVISLMLVGLAGVASAQIAVPPIGQGPIGQTLGGPVGTLAGTIEQSASQTVDRVNGLDLTAPVRAARALVRERIERLDRFVRRNRAQIEQDDLGEPARRGVVLLADPDPAAVETARRLGFTVRPVEGLDTLGLAPVELDAPAALSLVGALKRLRAALPGKTLSSDAIHFPSASAKNARNGDAGPASASLRTPVGLIDGGVAGTIPVAAQRGFATGGPVPSDHGTAIADLLRRAGVARVLAADVYGKDPGGGGALAIAQALGWLAGQNVPVVSISLVGPRNALLERAIAAASARGITIVAAVGNDGPASPPAYPASYPSVFAVTGVDGHDRALIEAGRALHLDYAAPGADMKATNAKGRAVAVRGTSFAVPFVAARAAAALDKDRAVRDTLDAEARDLGKKGPDELYGRGLLCGTCAR